MTSLALPEPLVRFRRKVFEVFGSARYSRVGLEGLDRKLERHLDFDGGFFVEAGAFDGVDQSNTYYLERFRGWRGLLVEAIPALAARCRRNRPRAIVEQVALAAGAQPGETMEMHYAGLMSVAAEAAMGREAVAEHVRRGVEVQGLGASYAVRVPVATLTELLARHRPEGEIDLLSLDVEGMEAQALRGLDLARFAPRFICVEVRERQEIESLLSARYRIREVLADLGSRCDVLFERTR
jgi:FkbM family methyltransferase